MSRHFLSVAARPQMNGKAIEVSLLAGSNPDPTTGDMTKCGELWMEPKDWEALRSVIVAGMHDVKRNQVGVEILDGTRRAGAEDKVVDFFRNFKT